MTLRFSVQRECVLDGWLITVVCVECGQALGATDFPEGAVNEEALMREHAREVHDQTGRLSIER
jgi:hypothetical protein